MILNHVENRSEEICGLGVDDHTAFYQILLKLFRLNPAVSIARILELVPMLPREEENIAQLVFEQNFTHAADVIDYLAEENKKRPLEGLLLLLNHLEPKGRVPRTLPWLKWAIRTNRLDYVESASMVIAGFISKGTPRRAFAALRGDLLRYLRWILNEGAVPRTRARDLSRLSWIALTASSLIGKNQNLLSALQGIYRLRNDIQLPATEQTGWMNSLNLATGRNVHPLDPSYPARENLQRILRLLNRFREDPQGPTADEVYRTMARSAAASLTKLDDQSEAEKMLQTYMRPANAEVFRIALARELTSLEGGESLVASEPACARLLTDKVEHAVDDSQES